MRAALSFAVLLSASVPAAADAPHLGQPAVEPISGAVANGPAERMPLLRRDGSVITANQPANCRERIQEARDVRGLPELDRNTASPDEPLLFKAVELQVGGCSVLVMHHNTADIRPLPQTHEPRLMPAK